MHLVNVEKGEVTAMYKISKIPEEGRVSTPLFYHYLYDNDAA